MHLYIGSYTQPHAFVPQATGTGIVAGDFDAETGRVTLRQEVKDMLNPSYLAWDPSGKRLLAVSENFDAAGAVHLFLRQPDGRLIAAGAQASPGRATCHVAVTPGGMVCVSTYLDGSLASYPLRGDELKRLSGLQRYAGRGPHGSRQEASHAHQAVVSPDGRWLYVCDLGADRIWCHPIETGGIGPPQADSCATPAGSGPRHLVFHPTQPRAYVIGELDARVLTCEWDAPSGRLTPSGPAQDSLSADWQGVPAAAAIRVHPSAATLYVSNRNHDSLTVFRLDQAGTATWAACFPAGGRTPRDFAFDPTGRWLVVANQDSNNLAIHAIDPASGLPEGRTPESVATGTPVCVLFAAGGS